MHCRWERKMGQNRSLQFSRSVVSNAVTLSNPMDCSFPGSATHGIFQARVLEWGALAFSKNIH